MPTKKSPILKGLNPEQKQAVTHSSGPLLIIAGAGTGKTSVITKKIAWIIEQKLAKPEEILALTFTDKAAGEMEQRVMELVPYGMVNIWISTFHAFGDRILRENSLDLGITSDFAVMTKPEQTLLFKDNIFKLGLEHFLPLGNPTKHIEAILDFFSRIKDEDISEDRLSRFAKEKNDPKLIELSQALIAFNKIKKEEGKLDFDDQIGMTLKLFRENPDVLKKYQEQFKYILIDEFQDTNYSQYQLVKLLAKTNGNVTVVADDDQSIYRFRGAAISNVLQFQKDYSTPKLVVLIHNYRSNQEILDSAYKLIQHNNPDRLEAREKIDKKLIATSHGQKPLTYTFSTSSEEMDFIASKIKALIDEKGYQYNDFAILVRANSQATPIMQALDFEKIPYHFTGRSGLYNRAEIRLIINFLKTLVSDEEISSMFHLATSSIYQLTPEEMLPIFSYTKKRNLILKRVLNDIVNKKLFTHISKTTYDKINNFLTDISKYQNLITEYTTGQLVYAFLTDSGYLKELLKIESPESEMQILNITYFFQSVIKKFELISKLDRSPLKFIEDLDLLMEAGDNPSTAQVDVHDNVVKIMTVHQSKGLEFAVVFITNLVQDRFPSRNRSEAIPVPDELINEILPSGDFHLQEERRLFYVAMTRAKDSLYLTWSKKYLENIKEKKPSLFILEATDEPHLEIASNIRPEEALQKYATLSVPKAAFKKFHTDKGVVLTPHQIDDYLTCPLKFKYVHLLDIPLAPSPQISFGNAIHKTIEFILKSKQMKQLPTVKEAHEVFASSWNNEGFITREHEERRFAEGNLAIEKFLEFEKNNPNTPAEIEQSFEFPYNDKLIIRGRFDTVYKSEKGIQIKDFKTSAVTTEKDALANTKKNRPLSVYALAIRTLEHQNPELTLHFVNSSIESTVTKSDKELEKLSNEIDSVLNGILEERFIPEPIHQACSFCPFGSICPKNEI